PESDQFRQETTRDSQAGNAGISISNKTLPPSEPIWVCLWDRFWTRRKTSLQNGSKECQGTGSGFFLALGRVSSRGVFKVPPALLSDTIPATFEVRAKNPGTVSDMHLFIPWLPSTMKGNPDRLLPHWVHITQAA